MRLVSSLCVLAFAGVVLADQPEAKKENPVQYCLQVLVYELTPDGEETILSRPQVVTLEGQEAFVQVGGEIAIPPAKEGGFVEYLTHGLTMRTKVNATKPGRVRLDLKVEKNEVDRSDKNGVRIAGKTLRCVETIRLGRSADFLVGEDANGTETWVQITARVHDGEVSKSRNEFGPPVLSRIPYLHRLFVKKDPR